MEITQTTRDACAAKLKEHLGNLPLNEDVSDTSLLNRYDTDQETLRERDE